jgi:hypothetical protein
MASLLDTEDDNQRIFRADAMASEVRVGIGGWEEEQGRPAQQSPWFAEEVTEEDAPWLFREGIGQAFRKIAALEMIATTACVRLFGNSEGHQGKTIKMVGETDNKGNSHVIAKLLTTKFPLCAVLMQLTIDLGRRGIDLDLAWVPREENVLADALSNGVTEGMDPSLRRRFSIKDLSTLTQLLEAGELLYGEVNEAKRRRVPMSFPPLPVLARALARYRSRVFYFKGQGLPGDPFGSGPKFQSYQGRGMRAGPEEARGG